MRLSTVSAGVLFTGILRYPYMTLSAAPRKLIVPMMSFFMAIIVSMASAPAGVSVFGDEILVFWREAASGHNKFAYYIGMSKKSSFIGRS